MKLVLVRHCRAFEASQDPERNLTPDGIKEAKIIGNFLKKTNWKFQHILTSSVKRAVQTAHILKTFLDCEVLSKNELTPNLAIENFNNIIQNFDLSDNLIFVLHMPDIAILSSQILKLPDENLFFSTGSAIGINIQNIRNLKGILVFLYQPEFLDSKEFIVE